MSFNNSFTPISQQPTPSGILYTNTQLLNTQEFNNPDGYARNYLSVGPVTQNAGTIRLTGTSVWTVI